MRSPQLWHESALAALNLTVGTSHALVAKNLMTRTGRVMHEARYVRASRFTCEARLNVRELITWRSLEFVREP